LTYIKNVSSLKFHFANCVGCGRCIEVCPRNVFEEYKNRVKIIDADRCMECGACMMNCAFGALDVDKGVGCAEAVINGMLKGTEPSCGCGEGTGCCG
jgi:NAD-dependent dihydropyrimidine dehydrogenase PreA subunit